MTALDPQGNARRYAAEMFGTFTLVFIGAGACIAHHGHPDDITHVGVALAFGGVVACMVYGLGHISGAHINPAVTVAFAAVKGFPLPQFGATFPVGTTLGGAFALEFILTFILMFVIMAVATDDRVPRGVGGLAIGAAVCIDCLAAGKCCGASMNPARSLGPALFAGGPALADLWLYFCAPTLGAMAAAVGYQQVRGGLTAATPADAGDSGHSRSGALKP
jgi:glycerol uptake facilitator-like aquaporin